MLVNTRVKWQEKFCVLISRANQKRNEKFSFVLENLSAQLSYTVLASDNNPASFFYDHLPVPP